MLAEQPVPAEVVSLYINERIERRSARGSSDLGCGERLLESSHQHPVGRETTKRNTDKEEDAGWVSTLEPGWREDVVGSRETVGGKEKDGKAAAWDGEKRETDGVRVTAGRGCR